MRVALVVPPWVRVPPVRYGGIEYEVALLADGLVERGHDVTVYTVRSSRSKGKVRGIFEEGRLSTLDGSRIDIFREGVLHSIAAYKEISLEGFDVVHDHTWGEGLACAAFTRIPTVHTIHGVVDERNEAFYRTLSKLANIFLVTISNWQRALLVGLPNCVGTVHNAVDVREFPYREEKEDFFLYLGRFCPEKGAHLACEEVRRIDGRLVLVGKLNERAEWEYFEREIKPYVDGKQIIFEGEVSNQRKKELLAHASALLVPLQWDEPFGIVMVEALACGTPVVAFNRGAAPEIVKNGEVGFVVNGFEEFVKRMKDVHDIDSRKCRERVVEEFSKEVMVKKYEEVYHRIVGEEPWSTRRGSSVRTASIQQDKKSTKLFSR